MEQINDNFTNANPKNNIETIEENVITKEMKIKINQVIDSYIGLFKINNLEIKKVNSGLTNYLFIISYTIKENSGTDEITTTPRKKIFLKLFGEISNCDLIDRKFETDLIDINSKSGLCGKCLFTDYKSFRIEELLEDISKPEDGILLELVDNNNFVNIPKRKSFINLVIEALLNFEFSLYEMENYKKYSDASNYSVVVFIKKIIIIANSKFIKFNEEYQKWLQNKNPNLEDKILTESLNKVKYYLENFEKIYLSITHSGNSNHDLNEIPLILNHNDVHKHNLLFHQENLLLIDYEYACLNHIGFDIINYCIESLFDLEYPVYPFYNLKVDNVDVLFNEPKYFQIYCKYIEKLGEKVKNDKKLEYIKDGIFDNFSNLHILRERNYFMRISGICSLFWFYCALISLDFDSYVRKDAFNYLDYSLARLAVYEKVKELLEN
jgi:thiamine kinase-like enzyme